MVKKGRLSVIAAFAVIICACGRNVTDSPFSSFVGEPYGSYHYALRDTLRKVYDCEDEKTVEKTISRMRRLPDKLHDSQWRLEAEFLSLNYQHDYLNGSDAAFISGLLALKEKAKNAGNAVFALRITRRLMDHYVSLEDSYHEILYASQLEKEMEGITEEEFPDIIDNAYRIAAVYVRHHEDARAMPLLNLVLSHEVIPEIQLIFLDAKCDLGHICQSTDIERSDSLFRSLTTDPTIQDKELWKGIGLGNLGVNRIFVQDYAGAEPLLLESYGIMEKNGDLSYCFDLAADLLSVYVHLGRAAEAEKWATTLRILEAWTTPESTSFRREMYSSLAEYEAMKGHTELSTEYKNRALNAVMDNYRRWSTDITSDIGNSLEEGQAAGGTKSARRALWIAIHILFLVSLGASLWFLFTSIRRKSQLITGMSDKAREWAVNSRNSPHIDQILYYLNSTKAYLEEDCALESVSKATGLNRNYVSKAVNAEYKNFSWMINSLRIKEALKILESFPDARTDELASSCGFSSRSTFYSAFKSVTGLSFAEFRRTL